MKKTMRFFAGLFTAVMLFSFTACSGDTTWAMKTETTTVPAGVYISYLIDSYNAALERIDSSKEVWDQQIDGVSTEQWIVDEATRQTKNYIAADLLFNELGLTLDTEAKNIIKTKADNYWASNQESCEKNGISFSSVEKLSENSYKAQAVFDYYYEKDGTEPVSDEAIKEYFYENYAKVKYVTISRTDVTTGEKIDEETLKKTVDGYVTEINKGKDIDEVIDSIYAKVYEDYGMGAYEPDTSDSSRNVSLVTRDQEGNLKGFAEKTFAQTEFNIPYTDESNDSYVYLGARYDLTKDNDIYEENRAGILYLLREDPFNAKLEAKWDGVGITVNDEAISRYSPKNLQ